MTSRILLIVVLLFAFADPALAKWWIVRASDKTCLVVDIEPKGNDKAVTKVGNDVYETSEQAEAAVKKLCGESKGEGQPRDSGNAE
jgi:hypothetical protein